MINRKKLQTGEIQITFVLDDPRPTSVVGDFNGWDPYRNPLVTRSSGLRSAAVAVPEGTVLRFRYLAVGGVFFDESDADALENNGVGGTHSMLVAALVGEA